MGAWGAHAMSGDSNSLTFKVNGRKSGHAYVSIILKGDDTYTIEAYKVRRVNGFPKRISIETVDGAYWDMLIPVIDRIVEGRVR